MPTPTLFDIRIKQCYTIRCTQFCVLTCSLPILYFTSTSSFMPTPHYYELRITQCCIIRCTSPLVYTYPPLLWVKNKTVLIINYYNCSFIIIQQHWFDSYILCCCILIINRCPVIKTINYPNLQRTEIDRVFMNKIKKFPAKNFSHKVLSKL